MKEPTKICYESKVKNKSAINDKNVNDEFGYQSSKR